MSIPPGQGATIFHVADDGKRYPRPLWFRITRWPFVLFATYVVTNYVTNAGSSLYNLIKQQGFGALRNGGLVAKQVLLAQLFQISPHNQWVGITLLTAILLLTAVALLALWDYKREREVITERGSSEKFQPEIDQLKRQLQSDISGLSARVEILEADPKHQS